MCSGIISSFALFGYYYTSVEISYRLSIGRKRRSGVALSSEATYRDRSAELTTKPSGLWKVLSLAENAWFPVAQ